MNPTYWSYPQQDFVSASTVRDAIMQRGKNERAYYENLARVFPVRLGPVQPEFVRYATTELFTFPDFDAPDASDAYGTTSALSPEGAELSLGDHPRPVLQQIWQAQDEAKSLFGRRPYVYLVGLQRGLHATLDSTGARTHFDVPLAETRKIGVVSKFCNVVNEAACNANGLNPSRFGITVFDHRAIPYSDYTYINGFYRPGTSKNLRRAEITRVTANAPSFTLTPNMWHLFPDAMLHHGGGYLTAEEMARVADNAIGYTGAINIQMDIRCASDNTRTHARNAGLKL